MRLPLYYLILITSIVAVTGCKEEKPKACFQAPLYAETGNAIVFKNCSENADTYQWNFGEGSSASSKEPGHTFQNTGTYLTTLSATNSEGTDETSQTIEVIYCSTSEFRYNISFKREAPVSTAFYFEQDTSEDDPGIVYEWMFPDSTIVLGNTASYDFGQETQQQEVIFRQTKGTCTVSRSFNVRPGLPSGVNIQSITVIRAPLNDSGSSSWDINGQGPGFSLADAQIKMDLLRSETLIDVMESDLPITFNSFEPQFVSFYNSYWGSLAFDATVVLELYDDDSPEAEDDQIIGSTMQFDNFFTSKPTSIHITNPYFEAIVELTWQ